MLVLGEDILSAVVQLHEGANILTGDFYLILWIFCHKRFQIWKARWKIIYPLQKETKRSFFFNEYVFLKKESHKIEYF